MKYHIEHLTETINYMNTSYLNSEPCVTKLKTCLSGSHHCRSC